MQKALTNTRARLAHTHLAAAAVHGLEQQRVADLLGGVAQRLGVLCVAVVAGHNWYAGGLHELLRGAVQRKMEW